MAKDTDHMQEPAPDAAIAVSAAALKRLVTAAAKHAGKDDDLAAALAPFTEL